MAFFVLLILLRLKVNIKLYIAASEKLSNYTKEKLLENLGNLTLIIRKLLCKKLMILLPSGGGAGHSDGPPTKLLSHAPNITAILPITELV